MTPRESSCWRMLYHFLEIGRFEEGAIRGTLSILFGLQVLEDPFWEDAM